MTAPPTDRLVRPQRAVALRLFWQISVVVFLLCMILLALASAQADKLLEGSVIVRGVGYSTLMVLAFAASYWPFYLLEARRWIRWDDQRLLVVSCGQEVSIPWVEVTNVEYNSYKVAIAYRKQSGLCELFFVPLEDSKPLYDQYIKVKYRDAAY